MAYADVYLVCSSSFDSQRPNAFFCSFFFFPFLSFLPSFFFSFFPFFSCFTHYFVLLALALACSQGLHLVESWKVTWEPHVITRSGKEGAGSRSSRARSLAARVTHQKARFPYDGCNRWKNSSVIVTIIWKPGLNRELASRLYSFPWVSRGIASQVFLVTKFRYG